MDFKPHGRGTVAQLLNIDETETSEPIFTGVSKAVSLNSYYTGTRPDGRRLIGAEKTLDLRRLS